LIKEAFTLFSFPQFSCLYSVCKIIEVKKNTISLLCFLFYHGGEVEVVLWGKRLRICGGVWRIFGGWRKLKLPWEVLGDLIRSDAGEVR
jgi:hypothetical protein